MFDTVAVKALDLVDPWLVGVWPGMGNVAIAAGGYLVEKLDAVPLGAFRAEQFFDADRAKVKEGVVQPLRLPRTQLYGWKNPGRGRDLVLLVGESQPAQHGHEFCQALLDLAAQLDVRRVVTFASMVTPSMPSGTSRVLTIATRRGILEEVLRAQGSVTTLDEGEILGLNGTLLAAAASRELDGLGLLGEVPQVAAGIPYLTASLAVLEVFVKLAGLPLDLDPMREQARRVEAGLKELVERLESLGGLKLLPGAAASSSEGDDDEAEGEAVTSSEGAVEAPGEDEAAARRLRPEDVAAIEAQFLAAAEDRGRAIDLKETLDRLGVFADYEDRFLDLFRPHPGPS